MSGELKPCSFCGAIGDPECERLHLNANPYDSYDADAEMRQQYGKSLLEAVIPAIKEIDSGSLWCITKFCDTVNAALVEKGIPWHYEYRDETGYCDEDSIRVEVGSKITDSGD